MNDVTFVDAVRLLNVVLAVVGLVWLVLRSVHRRNRYPYAMRLFLLTLFFYVLGVLAGSLEGLYNPPDGLNSRVFIFLVANIALITSLALSQSSIEEYRGPGADDGD